jgi:hypothetical protein
VPAIDLTPLNQGQQQDIQPIVEISAYLVQQSQLNVQFGACYSDTQSTLDLLTNSDELQVEITTYSQNLQSLADQLTTLVDFIQEDAITEASQLSKTVSDTQKQLYDQSLQAKIFVPSIETKDNINRASARIADYNEFNESSGLVER